MAMKDYKSEVTKPYGKDIKSYSDVEQQVLRTIAEDASARQYYEPFWQQYNYAYQTVLQEFQAQRKFNPDKSLEDQFSRMFQDKGRALSDYKLPVELAVVVRQVADEYSNLPKTNWVSLAPTLSHRDGKSRIFNYVYQWNYYEIDGDWETIKTLFAKAIYGTAIEYVYHEYREYKDFEPDKVVDGEVQYKEITRVISQSKFKNMDIRHVFFDANATDWKTMEHVTICENLTENSFKQIYGNSKQYDIDGVATMRISEVYLTLGEEKKGMTPPVIQVMKHFNKVTNTLCILANGKKINVKPMHIPIPALKGQGPLLPVAVYTDTYVDGEPYGLGKCAIVSPMKNIKNKLRNVFFDVSKKVAFNTLVIDPASDFDESTYEFGQPFVRALPDEVKNLPVSADLNPISTLDEKNDNDIIVFTGINFKDIAEGKASETATKSAIRNEAQGKLVEFGIKMNSVSGFKRRAILLKQLLKLHLSTATVKTIKDQEKSEPLQITTDGVQLHRSKGNKYGIREERTTGRGLFEVKAQDLEDDVDLMLEVGNIAATRELKKARQMEAAQFIQQMPPVPEEQEASMAYDAIELVKWAAQWGELPAEIVPRAVKGLQGKDPKDILNELDLVDKPPTQNDYLQNRAKGEGLGEAAAASAVGLPPEEGLPGALTGPGGTMRPGPAAAGVPGSAGASVPAGASLR